jgi:hypothetical protein
MVIARFGGLFYLEFDMADEQTPQDQQADHSVGAMGTPASPDQPALDDAGQRHIEEQRKADAENEKRQAANQPDPDTQVREAVSGQPVERKTQD